MKRTIARNIGLSFAIGLAVLTTDVASAQGKGNAKKEENQPADQQNSNQEEARERRHRPTKLKDIAEARKEEARAKGNDKNRNNSDKQDKGNKAEKENNGNAYGKNKGELSGREFGQARAAQARSVSEEKKKEFGKTVYEGDLKSKDARMKIARAREVLEKDKKDKKITDAAYNAKKARIDRAENAVQALEDKVRAAKQLEITIQ